MINERVSAAIGRPFAINGDLSVRWAREPDEGGWRGWVPWPHVSAQDISVGNAPWAKAPAFATLKRGEFSLSPLPLLSQRVVIRRIQLTEPAADLERLADGRANWQFTMPDTGEPSPWVLDINEIGFDKGQVGLRDEILKADLTLQVDPLGKPVPFADVAGADFAPQAPADGAPAAGSPTSPPAPPRERRPASPRRATMCSAGRSRAVQGPAGQGRGQGRRHAGHAGCEPAVPGAGGSERGRHARGGGGHAARSGQPGRAGPAAQAVGRIDGAALSADRRYATRHAALLHRRPSGGAAAAPGRRGVRLQGLQRQGRQ